MAYLAARLPALSLATRAVSAFTDAADRYRVAVGMDPVSPTQRPDRIAASFLGDRLMRIDGQPISGFAVLSGFFETRDGWIRTHANYPHHRARLLATVGLSGEPDRDTFAAHVRVLSATDIEHDAAELGAIAVRVRDETEWSASEPGVAAATGPLVQSDVREDCVATPLRSPTRAHPLAGVRVVDLTRVIAGPVATRALALLGAQVLRIDSPRLPEIEWQHLEVGQGKHSALLDLRTDGDAHTMRDLLTTADVLVTGYRPGGLEQLLVAPPGIVSGRVNAWGDIGPWAGRRGFDSIVQAASGISLIEGTNTPGALPAQALDHATGYFLAAGIIDALAERLVDGRGRTVAAALARTANWLLTQPRSADLADTTQPGDDTLVTHAGLRTARPAAADYDDYGFPARPWGRDAATWNWG